LLKSRKYGILFFLGNFNSGVSPRLLNNVGRYEMKVARVSFITGIVCSVLILQCCFAGQVIAAEPSKSKPVAEANKDGALKAAAQAVNVAEPNGPPPKIVFEQTTHDFGSVAPGSLNPCKFKFKNEGTGLLKISEVTKTCGCTVFTLEKKDYAPGESGAIDVGYNADKGNGPRTRHLFVLSNDPVNPRIDLTIKAAIAQKISYEPEKLDYTLRGEKAGMLELTVKSTDEQSFSITGFNSTGDAVAIEFDQNKKDTTFVLKTRIDTQKTGVNNSGRVEITTSHPDCPTITVPFNVLPRFKVDPPSINILNAEPGVVVKKELWLLNNYSEDFNVASTESKGNLIRVTAQEKVGTRYKFGLDILPPQTDNPSRMFTDTLTITIKDGEKIDVTCRGFYKKK
jgi:hypothetical protein